jgi:hypothetical protein
VNGGSFGLPIHLPRLRHCLDPEATGFRARGVAVDVTQPYKDFSTVPTDCQPPRDGPVRKRAERSMAIVSAMVGTVTLARIAPDLRISDSVLLATRDYIIRSVRRQR